MFPSPALTIGRLRARSDGAQPVIARLAAEALASEVAEALPLLPPQSLLFVRRVELLVAGDALSRIPGSALRRGSAAAVRSQLAVALAGAIRPASEAARDDAVAVLFADEAEMLACLARDALAGRLDRWWWRSVLGRRHPEWTQAFLDRPAAVSAALGLLARAGLAERVQASLAGDHPGSEHSPVPVGLQPGSAATRVDAERMRPSADQPQAAAAAPPIERSARQPAVSGGAGSDWHPAALEPAPAATASADDAPARLAVVQPADPETNSGRRSPGTPPTTSRDTARPSASNLPVAPSGSESLAADRQEGSADGAPGIAFRPTTDVPPVAGDPHAPRPPGAVPAADRRSPAGCPTLTERPRRVAATPGSGHAASIDGHVRPVRSDSTPTAGRLPASSPEAPPGIPQPAPPSAPASERGEIDRSPVADDLAPALEAPAAVDEPAAWLLAEPPRVIVTRCARLLFLVNLLLGDGLYPDFTRPAERGFPVSLWRLLALLGVALAGPEFRDDPLHAALVALADESPPDPRLETTDLAASWPIPEPPGERRLRARSLRRQARNGFARWFARYRISVRRRLAAALSVAPARVGSAFWQERGSASVWLSPSEVVAVLPLAEHPVVWRLAGLDRDPGHLPSTGRSLRFVFE
ncbi:hypothetical protein [Accumulibacter sp.]|uniref:hypothetical protein n=1 Tax=Accumulibacter sp. TaxID=2053492 RepID=UPI0025CF6FD2|nr:hypothetical protein [Accumulibacter sp.]MCM8593864.1 hypothetical protein [Accumulibacter sp.]MCM8626094.1 hypothetical protein [Accumulibacter sp.]MDS4048005.1 hypothetical protein [Accumulibacter sp.]